MPTNILRRASHRPTASKGAEPQTRIARIAIGKVSMEAVSKSIMVFYIPMLIVLGLVTYIPELTLWLPRLMLGK